MSKNTAPAADERDSEIARLRTQLAALAPRTEDERDRAERRALELADEAEEAAWLALPDDASRTKALRGVVSDARFVACCRVIGEDAVLRIASAHKSVTERLVRVHPNRRVFEILLTPDNQLPKLTKVTGSIGVTQDCPISPELADQCRALGIDCWAGDRTHWYRGIALQGRPWRLVNSAAWALRVSIDSDIAAALQSGRLRATPLSAADVRALMIRGEQLP
jgi:hypothetical protein